MKTRFREINLEDGRPTVREILSRLDRILEDSGKGDVIKFIHGYGSSGTGGKIRIEFRKKLTVYYNQNRISYFVCGEKFSIFDENSRNLLNAVPALRKDHDLDRHNNGVTYLCI